jgi:nicotinamide-nucleotide amidase
MGESFLEQKIAGPVAHLLVSGLDLGYCARTGEVDLRFVARGPNAQAVVAEAEKIARAVLGDIIFGSDDDQLQNVIVQLLTERKQTLCLAESCTGGYIANRLTNVPGASAVLLAGLVTYSNESKQKLLGVTPEGLAEHGAVSNPVARQMAEGARHLTNADFAISVTGIAGPSGATETKPVGTVFIGLATPQGTDVRHHRNTFDRETFKYVTSQQALELLRRAILSPG